MIELHTERLRLGIWEPRHFEPYARYYDDEEMARWVGGQMSHDRSWRHLAAVIGHWTLKGYGYWPVEERATGDFVGCVGLWFSDGWPELELGYWIVRDKQGKGYATEAGTRCREYAFGELQAKTLVSYIHPDNDPSRRVAERLGARYEKTIELLEFGPHEVHRYPR